MKTDKNISSHFSFSNLFKVSLAAGFGLFGGAQLISGYWVLGLMSLGLGAVFAKDSLELFKQHYTKPNPQTVLPNQNKSSDLSDDSTKKDDKKQKNQSEPRHKPVPTLNLAAATGAVHYTPLATAESGGSTPGSAGLSRKKKNRFSQRPTPKEIETVRAMTEEEVDELASRPSPKQTERKQTINKK